MNLSNTQFVFTGTLKRNLFIGMGIGALCLVLSALGDDQYYTRFWSNFLHNSVFFTGISFMAMFFLSAQITAFAGWNAVVKRLWEAMSQFMVVGLVLVAVIVAGVWGHFHHLYHWNTPGITTEGGPLYDRIIAGKAGFLNPVFFTIGTLGFLAIWYYWARGLRAASIAQDTEETEDFRFYKKQRKWAASYLPIWGFLSSVFIWLITMSIDSHWYSTMFGWYSLASLFLAMISLFIMIVLYLKSEGYMQYVSRDHLHDLGNFLFGISVFWTYLWFDQFMLIWYANNGEETIYFFERMEHYPVLFWGNLLMNFVAPFFILMRNDTKRKFGTLFFAAAIVFFGHWWDFFYMIKPGARIAAHESAMHSGAHSSTMGQDVAPFSFEKPTEKVPTVLSGVQAHEAPTEAKPAEGHQEGQSTETPGHEGTAGQQDGHAPAADAPHGGEAVSHGEGHEGHEAEHGDSHEGDKSFKMGYTIPGLEELGILIGFLSLFLFFVFGQLEKASLVPMRDPYLEESLHHETGVMIDSEQEEKHDHGHDDHHH